MLQLLRDKLAEVLAAIAPLIGCICLLQLLLVQAPLALFLQFLLGSAFVVVGMLLLFIGIDIGIVPMGRFIGARLPQKRSLLLMLAVAFALGFVTTLPEPDVLVLAGQIEAGADGAVSGQLVLYAIALGVAVLTALATARIVFGWPLRNLLAAAYLLALVLALLAPPDFVSLAFDGGSVTTGVLSAPVIIALAVGISSVLAGRSAVTDGFGVVGFASIGPILVILLMGLLQ
jgi:hypothetical protein